MVCENSVAPDKPAQQFNMIFPIFELVSQFTPREQGGARSEPLLNYPAWAAPILSHGLIYVRGANRVACFELIPDK